MTPTTKSSSPATQRTDMSLASLVKAPAIARRFEDVLGRSAAQFVSSLIQVGKSLGDDCDPMSIIGGAMTAATLGLPINKNLGFAWLVPFRDRGVKRAQFQIGYKGYIQLAQRSGQYRRMNAGELNAECLGEFDAVGERTILFDAYDPAKPAAAYFLAFETVTGFRKIAVWTRERVAAHATKYSESFRSGRQSPWTTHFGEMAVKTVIANELRRWGVMSVDLWTAAERDQAVIIASPETGAETIVFADNPGPVTTEPEPDAPPEPVNSEPAHEVPVPEPRTACARLAELMSANGIAFDEFRRWYGTTQAVKDTDALASFDDIPEADAERLLRAKTRMVTLIKGGRGV